MYALTAPQKYGGIVLLEGQCQGLGPISIEVVIAYINCAVLDSKPMFLMICGMVNFNPYPGTVLDQKTNAISQICQSRMTLSNIFQEKLWPAVLLALPPS